MTRNNAQMIRVGRVPFFDLCSKNVQIELATSVEAECDAYLT